MGIDPGSRYLDNSRSRTITAVLGPTNTGKTHLAIERMVAHDTGMIGLPLRLLAREVYDKLAARVGAGNVALITGEEKIKPERARYWVCTVEAMPRVVDVDFLAIDEIQLAADPERGHVFTDRLLHARGRVETLLLGAQTMGGAINDLIPGANFISRPRLSKLTYSGQKKITRLPHRSAIVAFGAGEVYAIAELIRRQRGGAAVVLGALSPRTRNAQVALYQSGDVDYMVATDAIGMGLNLDVDHVAFAGTRKFDGQVHRELTPAELAQVAGRAGRHMNDGTFGVTGDVEPFGQDVVDRLENHNFDPVKVLQWRTRDLDFASLDRLRDSLRNIPDERRLTRARMADDVTALETLASGDPEVVRLASSPAAVAKLWDVCQVPDYRKISTSNHAELVGQLYKYIVTGEEKIDEDWFAKQVDFANRTDGDIDTLANRIAHIRTWTFVSNRAEWLKDPVHWQERTRAIEDALSDALHEQLTQRFVDRKTSALMRGLRDKEELTADIASDGAIQVENHYVGRLKGFRFFPDATPGDGIEAKAARNAATAVLSKEFAMRARRVAAALPAVFKLTKAGRIEWQGEEIAWLEPSDNPLKPQIKILCDEYLQAPDKEKVQARLDRWLGDLIEERLKPLVEISNAQDIEGLGRGIAFRLVENFGCLKREGVAEEIRTLDQNSRAQLRKYGVRFGAFNIYFPPLLKPAPVELLLQLWTLKHGPTHGLTADTLPDTPKAGLTSLKTNPAIPESYYRTAGFHLCGPRAVRVDMLERLADLIRPLMAWRARPPKPQMPATPATGNGESAITLATEAKTTSDALAASDTPADTLPPVAADAPASETASLLGDANTAANQTEPIAVPTELAPAEATAPETAAPATPPIPAPTPPKGATGDGGFTVIPEMMSILGCGANELSEVLKTLGFRVERKEIKVKPAPAKPIVAPSGTEVVPANGEGVSANGEAHVEPQPSTPTDAAVEAVTQPAAEAATLTPADPVAPESETRFIEIWRPRRRHAEGNRERFRDRKNGQGRRPSAQAGGQSAAPAGEAVQAAGAKPEQRGGERGERRGWNAERDSRRARGEGGSGPREARNDNRDSRSGQAGGHRKDEQRSGYRRDEQRGGYRARERGDRDRDRGGQTPRVTEARPKAKSAGVDPDNPFAALSKLKKELEDRSQNRS